MAKNNGMANSAAFYEVNTKKFESYCNLELLQLLYNNGFRFKLSTEGHRVTNNLAEQKFNEGDVTYCKDYITYSIVVEWIRLVHNIDVYPKPQYINGKKIYDVYIWFMNKDIVFDLETIMNFNTPQEAYSKAFNFILNKLI
jgi:hypothetical protein